MEQVYGIFERLIQILMDSGLLDALGDTVTDILSKYSENLIMLLWNLFLELLRKSTIFLIGVIVIAALGLLLLLVLLISYILRSIGLMRIAKKLGVKRRFLAWVPIGSEYLVGECAEKSIARNGKKSWKWGLILALTFVATTVGMPIVQAVVIVILYFFPAFSAILNLILECASLIYMGLYTYCLFRIYKEFSGTSGGLLFALCSLFLGLIEGVFTVIVSCLQLRDVAPAPAEDGEDATE